MKAGKLPAEAPSRRCERVRDFCHTRRSLYLTTPAIGAFFGVGASTIEGISSMNDNKHRGRMSLI